MGFRDIGLDMARMWDESWCETDDRMLTCLMKWRSLPCQILEVLEIFAERGLFAGLEALGFPTCI